MTAIVIVGDGVAGALAAAVLASALPRATHSVTLVGTPDYADLSLGPCGSIEATGEDVFRLHERLGLDEADLLRATGGSFSLGKAYSGWSQRPAFFAPFGDIGATMDGVAFHQLTARLRSSGASTRTGDFAIATIMAQAGRFVHPSGDARSPLSTFSYALHLPLRAYADELLRVAERFGAIRIGEPVADAEFDEHGRMQAIRTSSGGRIEGNLFIDAGGTARPLISRMGVRFESWQAWLPCDRAVQLDCAGTAPAAPYSLSAAVPVGWQRTVPSGSEVGETLYYSSRETDDGAAEALLRSRLAGETSTTAKFHELASGRLDKCWVGNCLALGAAAAVLEPLHLSPLLLLQRAVERLLKLLPARLPAEAEALEYVRLTNDELDRARDGVILHYKTNRRTGESLWDFVRQMDVPEALAEKLEGYARRGHIPLLDGDLLGEDHWALLMEEQGVVQQRYDLLADTLPIDGLSAKLARMRELLINAVAPLPRHADYLAHVRRSAAA